MKIFKKIDGFFEEEGGFIVPILLTLFIVCSIISYAENIKQKKVEKKDKLIRLEIKEKELKIEELQNTDRQGE